jgi:hypothetical protein
MILKSRKAYLKELAKNIRVMEFMSERNRTRFLETIESEIDLVQRKIDDLIW